MIWHEQVSFIATAGRKLKYLFRARKYFSPSNLLTLYKAQITPSLEYCSHIWGAAASTILSILDAVQRRTIRLLSDPALTCRLQPLCHRHAVADSEQWFSTLKRIKTFLRSTMAEDRLNALAVLSIEKKFVQSIPDFDNKVIEIFSTKKARRMDFMYKTLQ
nr:unnamed protein product [Callosobruchus chinensis]